MRIYSILSIVLVICSLLSPAAFAAQLKDIVISGTERIEASTVKSYLPLNIGDDLSDDLLDTSLKNLFSTGFFADVQIEERGNIIYINVVENPVINKIAFEGNDKVKDNELLNEISLRPRNILTRTKVQADVARLLQIYRTNGRFSANIDPKIIRLDQNRVNLVFEIQEGAVTEIKSIKFVGNKEYSDSDLRGALSSRENAWFRFLSSADRYDPDRLSFDQELLRRFYLKRGYADFRVLSAVAELSESKRDFFLTFTVEEGARYKIRKTHVHSNLQNFDSAILKKNLKIKEGDWYNVTEIENSVTALTEALDGYGYSFVRVVPDVHRNRETQTIDVVFSVNEAPKVFVERIDVKGNVRTLDRVIRREFEMVEGDPLTNSDLARSEQNLRDLSFFENVDVETRPGSTPDRRVLEVDVAEKSTGELSVGAGFSTNDGPLADFRIRERNFLGKGQELVLASTIAGRRTEFDLSILEPFFLGRDISAGVDVFHITRDLQRESSFDQKRTGGGFQFGFPLSENLRDTIRYRIETNEITDVDANASRFVRDQEGERITSAISNNLTYTDLDSLLFPTKGIRSWLDTEVAGLGGDARFVSGRVGSQYFHPLSKNITLSVLGEFGAVEAIGDEEIQINERFFLGGQTLRGFEASGVGPRDITTDDALGGNYFYRGSVEGSFPVGLPEELGVKGHIFTDFGSLFEPDNETGPEVADSNSIRATAGVGLSWRSPFGPIRVDVAAPYADEEEDETEVFRFSFGTQF